MNLLTFLYRPFLLGVLFLLTASSVQAVQSPQEGQVSNQVVAIVEDRVITLQEVRQQMSRLIPDLQRMSSSQEEFRRNYEQTKREIIEGMVDRVLVVKEFERRGWEIPQSAIERRIESIIEEDFNGSRVEFLRYLQDAGETSRSFRRRIEESFIVQEMEGQRRHSRTTVSPVLMQEFYEENPHLFTEDEAVQLRLIELKVITAEPEDVLEQTAETIFAELEEGKSFGELARRYSQHRSREDGGFLGWIEVQDLREDWREEIRDLSPGETSGLIRTGDSFFILHVEDHRQDGVQPIHKVRDRIEEELVNMTMRQDLERWFERLRNRYFVRYFD
ncbi:MAG: SurA N-terminal domain-containing protein [Opitutales bacterium]|nr:SurA N-terminal domain-containing protein [Opitutales bacterium]